MRSAWNSARKKKVFKLIQHMKGVLYRARFTLTKLLVANMFLGKPPNKPGGAWKLSTFLMLCWLIPECVEGIKLEEDNPADFVLIFFGISFKKCIGLVVMLLLFSLIVWFICLDVNEDFEGLPI